MPPPLDIRVGVVTWGACFRSVAYTSWGQALESTGDEGRVVAKVSVNLGSLAPSMLLIYLPCKYSNSSAKL